MTHPGFTALTDAAIGQQLSGAEPRSTAGGADPRPLFRFPFGDRDARTIATVNRAATARALDGGHPRLEGHQRRRHGPVVADRVLAGCSPERSC